MLAFDLTMPRAPSGVSDEEQDSLQNAPSHSPEQGNRDSYPFANSNNFLSILFAVITP
jgi:hypothetical protein